MIAQTPKFPLISKWDDAKIGSPSGRDFAELLYRRALAVGEDLYDATAYERIELDASEYQERLTFYLRRRAWAEWYFGVGTPARQITLLPDDWIEMKLRLSRQIVDEMRHYEVFSKEVRRRGGEWRLAKFPIPEALLRMYQTQMKTATAAELAAANQYSGEIVLSLQTKIDNNVLRLQVDEATMSAIEDIETDEPAHIAIGRDLVRTYATSPACRRRMALSQERFLEALVAQHSAEIEMLGARRCRPLPQFVERNE